ncbi:uncharacterized protein [Phyllobates terribilis]|uniref:uncharacterized protein n=1 Tax=Phyllobates terribilis TaxID=111132 RepID=UPI003CCAFB0C
MAQQPIRFEEAQQELNKLPQSVLDCPEPPSLWKEVVSSSKRTVFPFPGNNGLSSKSSKKRMVSNCFISFLHSFFPFLTWGRNYNAGKLRHDVFAGLTLASLSIPQSIGYASLAKMEPQYGLYTSVVPPLIYALMGSSREIAIGPVAVVSLLLSSLGQKVVDPSVDPVAYRELVLTATFFAGMFQTLFAVCRLGFLVDFLSHAAIVGFMGGAAIVIGLQQLKGLFGISHFTTKTDAVSVLKTVFVTVHQEWYPLNFLLGCSLLVFILSARFMGRRVRKLYWMPALAPLVAVIFSTLLVYVTKADHHGVKIVKHVKGGLNPISAHQLQFKGPHVGSAMKIGLLSAVVALTEAMAVGRSFASIKGYQIDGNKEMLAMGFMNIIGSVTSCYVATGSFSRTAVNFSAGCETVVSNVVMAITVLISLQFLTKLLYFTPVAVLASIILSALPGLIDLHEAHRIWKIDKLDFLACIGAFFGVLFGSVEIGLLTAVMISFAKIILNAVLPRAEILGRLNGTKTFCEVNRYPLSIIKPPGLLIIRINSALLCFANANFIKERVARYVVDEVEDAVGNAKTVNHTIILDLSSVMHIDTSGIIALEDLYKKLVSLGVNLAVASPQWQVIHKLKLVKFVDKVGERWFFLTVNEAVEACFGSACG